MTHTTDELIQSLVKRGIPYVTAVDIYHEQIKPYIENNYILKSEVEAAIGEDEYKEYDIDPFMPPYPQGVIRGQNRLRAEIRKQLKLEGK